MIAVLLLLYTGICIGLSKLRKAPEQEGLMKEPIFYYQLFIYLWNFTKGTHVEFSCSWPQPHLSTALLVGSISHKPLLIVNVKDCYSG